MDTTDSNVVPLGRHPTPEELMARARALVPMLQERAQRCEDQRRVPEETIEDFERAGLLRMCQPARYGGYEMGWDVLCDIAEVLAAADGSQAWLQHIFADHTVLVATFPAQAQEEVWGKNHSTITSASFDPAGRAARVEGGFLYSGRHGFSSGIDYAELADLRRHDRGEGRPRRSALLPGAEERRRGARRLGDNGARRHRLEDLRRHRQVHSRASFPRWPPVAFRNRSGTAVNKAAVYRAPRFGGTAAAGFSALAVGMARGVLAEWLACTGPRTSRGVAVGAQQGHADPGRALRGRDRRRPCALSDDGARRHAQARGGRHREQRRAPDRPAQHRLCRASLRSRPARGCSMPPAAARST